MQRGNIKNTLDTYAVVKMFVNSNLIISPLSVIIRSFCVVNEIGTTIKTRKVINNKWVAENSCFIFGVVEKLLTFDAIRSIFA